MCDTRVWARKLEPIQIRLRTRARTSRVGPKEYYYISLNLGPAAGPVQAITIALQLPIIETRVTILLGLARADGRDPNPVRGDGNSGDGGNSRRDKPGPRTSASGAAERGRG